MNWIADLVAQKSATKISACIVGASWYHEVKEGSWGGALPCQMAL